MFLIIFVLIVISEATEITFETEIPKIVHQTYHLVDKIPAKVHRTIAKFAKFHKRYIYNDTDCIHLLNYYFSPAHGQLFRDLTVGPHKADLCRYAIMYVYGGVYLDIKTMPLVPFDYIFGLQNTTYTVISFVNGAIHNGIIASPRGNPIFLELVDYMMQFGFTANKGDYFYNCRKFFEVILRDTNLNELRPGLLPVTNSSIFRSRFYYLFEEKMRSIVECFDGPDRYGRCDFAYTPSGEKVFRIRYADYPWICEDVAFSLSESDFIPQHATASLAAFWPAALE